MGVCLLYVATYLRLLLHLDVAGAAVGRVGSAAAFRRNSSPCGGSAGSRLCSCSSNTLESNKKLRQLARGAASACPVGSRHQKPHQASQGGPAAYASCCYCFGCVYCCCHRQGHSSRSVLKANDLCRGCVACLLVVLLLLLRLLRLVFRQ